MRCLQVAADAAVPRAARDRACKRGRSSDEEGGEQAPPVKRVKRESNNPPADKCPQVHHCPIANAECSTGLRVNS